MSDNSREKLLLKGIKAKRDLNFLASLSRFTRDISRCSTFEQVGATLISSAFGLLGHDRVIVALLGADGWNIYHGLSPALFEREKGSFIQLLKYECPKLEKKIKTVALTQSDKKIQTETWDQPNREIRAGALNRPDKARPIDISPTEDKDDLNRPDKARPIDISPTEDKDEKSQSFLANNMIVDGNIIGLIRLSSTQEAAFCDETAKLLAIISHEAGLVANRIFLNIEAKKNARAVAFANEELRDRMIRLNSLLKASDALTGTLDIKTIIRSAMLGISRIIPIEKAIIFVLDPGKKHYLPLEYCGYCKDEIQEKSAKMRADMGDNFTIARQPYFALSALDYPIARLPIPGFGEDKNQTIATKDEVRLAKNEAPPTKNDIPALIIIESLTEKRALKDDEIEILTIFANSFSAALNNSHQFRALWEKEQIMENEVKQSALIQKSLLPPFAPQLRGFEIACFYSPARIIGGDYYDFIPLPNDKMGVVIADVSGKGMPAALLMTMTKGMLLTIAPNFDSPSQVMEKLNDFLIKQLDPYKFITMIYMIFDPLKKTVEIANAGHEYPILFSGRDAILKSLATNGVPLGIKENSTWPQEKIELNDGDGLFLYTDGLSEANKERGLNNMFGNQRIMEIIDSSRGHKAQQILDKMKNSLMDFTEYSPLKDDLTMLLIKADRGIDDAGN